MSIRDTLILSRAEVRDLLPMDRALAAVEAVFAAHGAGETRMPPKIYLDLPEFAGDFRAMPAYIPSQSAAGVKWVSSHAKNPSRGRPAVLAVLVLSDPETAEPLAVMDGTHLTSMRTGAAGGVAAKYLSREDSTVLALLGAGVQSHAQLEAIRLVRPIDTVRVFDPDGEAVAALAARHAEASLSVVACESAADAASGADIVATTTPSRRPIIERDAVGAGTHINAIGADAPGKQELDPALLGGARIFIDDRKQAFHSGEVNVPLSAGVIRAEQIVGTLGAVVAGQQPGRTDDEQITVFDSTGLAVQDMAVARLVYDRALAQGVGHSVPLVCG
ncbi:MAG: ornithine cyclodeaminase family protein [Acidobacteriota bacterium]